MKKQVLLSLLLGTAFAQIQGSGPILRGFENESILHNQDNDDELGCCDFPGGPGECKTCDVLEKCCSFIASTCNPCCSRCPNSTHQTNDPITNQPIPTGPYTNLDEHI